MNKKHIIIISIFLAIFSSKTHGMNCLVYNHHQKTWNKTISLADNQKNLVKCMIEDCIHKITDNSYAESFKKVLSTISQNIYGCELMRRIISVYHNEQNTTKCSFFSKPIDSEKITTTITVDNKEKCETFVYENIIDLQYQSVSFHVLQKKDPQSEQICISFSSESGNAIWTDDVILFTSMVHWLHYITASKLTIDMCKGSVDALLKYELKYDKKDYVKSTKLKCCIYALGNAEECLATTGYNAYHYAERYNFINTNEYLLSKTTDGIQTMITPHIVNKVMLSIGDNIEDITDTYKVEDYFLFKQPPYKRLKFGKGDYQYNKQSIWWKIGQIFTCTKGGRDE